MLAFCFGLCQNSPRTREKEFVSVFRFSFGDIAQLVEQMTFNHWVKGSNPFVSTKINPQESAVFFCFIECKMMSIEILKML